MALVVEHTLLMRFQLRQSRHRGRLPLHSAFLVVKVQTHYHQAYHETYDDSKCTKHSYILSALSLQVVYIIIEVEFLIGGEGSPNVRDYAGLVR